MLAVPEVAVPLQETKSYFTSTDYPMRCFLSWTVRMMTSLDFQEFLNELESTEVLQHAFAGFVSLQECESRMSERQLLRCLGLPFPNIFFVVHWVCSVFQNAVEPILFARQCSLQCFQI